MARSIGFFGDIMNALQSCKGSSLDAVGSEGYFHRSSLLVNSEIPLVIELLCFLCDCSRN